MTHSKRPRTLLCVAALAALAAQTATATVPNYGDSPVGFYQIVAHEGEVFAAFGGTMENYMTDPVTQPAGTVPGALFVFDAATLALKEEIPLQAIGGALALNPAKNQIIVGHTHNHAISTVDLKTRQASYHVLDTTHAGNEYRMRYVATDSAGDVYVSTFDWLVPFKNAIFKFDSNGQRDGHFKVPASEGFSLPVSVTKRLSNDGHEQVLFGNATVRLANAKTGAIEYTSATRVQADANATVNFYNYIDGPGGSLIATSAPGFMDGNQGDNNLYLFQKGKEDQPQKLFTGATALEAIYNPKAGQLYASSYASQLVSIVALDDKTSLDDAQFENLRFKEGIPSNISMQQTGQGTDLFVTLRTSASKIAKVHIAADVKGIEGIRKPGACSVSTWDLGTRSVEPPVPCEFADIEQQFKDNLESARAFAKAAPGQLEEAQKAQIASVEDEQKALKAWQAKPDDAELKSAYETARFGKWTADFMLEAARRVSQNPQHVADGAERFLKDWQAKAAKQK